MYRKASICLFAAFTACWAAGLAWALNAKQVAPNIYGFDQASDNDMLIVDLNELIAQKRVGKVVIFGGVHGYANTGTPHQAQGRDPSSRVADV